MSAEQQGIGADLGRWLSEGRIGLPTLDPVVRGVIHLGNDPDAGPEDVAELIQPVEPVTSEVLKSANSVAYGGRVEIESLPQAIARLGTQRVTEICIATCIRQQIFVTKGFRAEMQALWRQCFATGLFAREIAMRCDAPAESAFVQGLFQRLGSALVLRALLERLRARATQVPESVLAELDWHFCVPCGRIAVEAWGLSDEVRAVVDHAVAIETDAPLPDRSTWIGRRACRHAKWALSAWAWALDTGEVDEIRERIDLDEIGYREVLRTRDAILESVDGEV